MIINTMPKTLCDESREVCHSCVGKDDLLLMFLFILKAINPCRLKIYTENACRKIHKNVNFLITDFYYLLTKNMKDFQTQKPI